MNMFFKSIRFKIVFWYTLVLSLTFFTVGMAVYHNLSKKLLQDKDNQLLLRAEGIADSIDTYWETEKMDAAADQEPVDYHKVNNINFKKIAQRWVKEEGNDPSLLNIVVQIFDNNGELIASSKNIPGIFSLSKKTFQTVLKGRKHFDDMALDLFPAMTVPFRVLTIPVNENNQVAYIVRVASPLTSLGATLRNLKLILLILLPLAIVLSGAVAFILSKLTLNPINRIIATAQRITTENLKLRIPQPETRDEIQRLAETFNETLERLEQGFNSQQQFIEDLAHELKTPLAIIKGEAEVTLKEMRSAEDYTSVLRSNLEEVDRIIKIVENLLILARLDKNLLSIEKSKLDISVLLKDTLNDIDILARSKNIRLSFSGCEKALVLGNEDNLKRLFLNLLDNAIKYTPPQGRVTVTINKEKNWTKILIADSGIGITENALPHIFDRFYGANKKSSHPGFGLGLSIAKSIVIAHQGKIEVQSTPNQGTTFSVFLPLSS